MKRDGSAISIDEAKLIFQDHDQVVCSDLDDETRTEMRVPENTAIKVSFGGNFVAARDIPKVRFGCCQC